MVNRKSYLTQHFGVEVSKPIFKSALEFPLKSYYTIYRGWMHFWQLLMPHLSKHPSDLKQNGTQEKTPLSGTVFNALTHGVIRFVASVSSKNHHQTG